jgi:mono/diheme cytochrome c family protein
MHTPIAIGFLSLAIIAGFEMRAAAGDAPPSQSSPPAPATPPMTPERMQAVTRQYCVTCHNDRLRTGGVSLDAVDYTNPTAHAETLEKAARKVFVGAMPPLGSPRPEAAVLDGLRTGIEASLDRAATAEPAPGRAILRRLNRTEYANAVRSAGPESTSRLLPVDNSSYGFDNIGDVLGVSPVLMERYLAAARRISAAAVGDRDEIIATADTYKVRPDMSQDRHIEGLPLGTRGGVAVTHHFPLDADYSFKIDLPGHVEQRGGHGVSARRRADDRQGQAPRDDRRRNLVRSYANSQGRPECSRRGWPRR